MSRWDEWPPKTKPLHVEGGIKAQTKRGAFGQRWWAKRWIAVLESFHLGSRLSRGRAYARSGQVVDIAVEPGGVRARVQGSRAAPYEVTIRLRELTAAEWHAVGAAISANTRLAALLLAGEMPEDIESAFATAGTTLFPKTEKELKTACSCPDWSNPCKHVAAVFYLIGEEFDRDPFLLFVVRGLPRERIRELPQPAEPPQPVKAQREGAKRPAPLSGEAPVDFWGAEPSADVSPAAARSSAVPLAVGLLRRAGRFPFWRADESLEDALAPVYARAAETALAWLADHPDA